MHMIRYIFIGFLLCSPSLSSASVSHQHVQIDLVPEHNTIQPGQSFWVGVHFKLDKHWHVYWANPGDSGLPTQVEWQLPKGFKAGPLQWPYPQRIPYGPLVNYGYEDSVLLLSQLTAPANLPIDQKVRIAANVSWLVCQEECIPGDAQLSATLSVTQEPVQIISPWQKRFKQARERLPKTVPQGMFSATQADDAFYLHSDRAWIKTGFLNAPYFFPLDEMLVDAKADQAIEESHKHISLQLKKHEFIETVPKRLRGVLVSGNEAYQVDAAFVAGMAQPVSQAKPIALWKALLLAFLGGVLLNLMPCVFPVLSIKVLSFTKKVHGADHHVRKEGISYTLGVLLTFSLLAAALLILRATGEQLGWGFQLQSPWFIAILIYVMFALALSMSGFFEIGLRLTSVGQGMLAKEGYWGSFFTGILAVIIATPCTAPFMGAALGFAITQPAFVAMGIFLALGLGMALPYLLLSFYPQAFRFLPKPGAWMETFKQCMAFPLYATVVWLLWVLGIQSGLEGVIGLLTGLVFFVFSIWLFYKTKNMKRILAFIMLLISIAWSITTLRAALVLKQASNISYQQNGAIAYDRQQLQDYLQQDKTVFVNFTAAWCVTCQVNDQVAFRNAKVQQAFKEKGVIYMKADWTNRSAEITQALGEFGRNGVPLYVLYIAGHEPNVLPQILTPGIILDALNEN